MKSVGSFFMRRNRCKQASQGAQASQVFSQIPLLYIARYVFIAHPENLEHPFQPV